MAYHIELQVREIGKDIEKEKEFMSWDFTFI